MTTIPLTLCRTLLVTLLFGLTACNEQDSVTDNPPSPDAPSGPETPANGDPPDSEDPSPPAGDCMNDRDREMLDRINRARASSRQCGAQSYPAAPPLTWNCTLATVALEHSRDMGERNFFSHTGSDGLSSSQRVTNASYSWRTTGENIAAGLATVEEVMAGWLSSPGHCANIMNDSYTEIGAARYHNSGADYRYYWTQLFATPR